MSIDEWVACYDDGWKGEIVLEAFAHPAKYSRALIRRIYDHISAEGWLSEGDTVIDPFGGVALGGLDAMRLGCRWFGCELEEKFVALGGQNIALWNSRYAGRFAKWGTATLVRGDSRRLLDVVSEAGVCVSSPPFSGDGNMQPVIGQGTRAQLRAQGRDGGNRMQSSPGNLALLRADERDWQAAAAVAVSSPPYATGARHTGGDDPHPEYIRGGTYHGVGIDAAISSPPYPVGLGRRGTSTGGSTGQPDRVLDAMQDGYGQAAGQLGAMAEGSFAAAVSSPPYEAISTGHKSGTGFDTTERRIERLRTAGYSEGRIQAMLTPGRRAHGNIGEMEHYTANHDNLSNQGGDSFWSAAREIVSQTHAALRPGGYACWVVKAFVRNKQIVDFPGQWRQLCKSVGFVTLHEHRASLVKDNGTQLAMDGTHKRKRTERKSFFRRLAESKGSPPIDYEVVFCMVKQ